MALWTDCSNSAARRRNHFCLPSRTEISADPRPEFESKAGLRGLLVSRLRSPSSVRFSAKSDGRRAIQNLWPTNRLSQSGSCNGGCLVLLIAGFVIIAAIAWGAISTYQGAYQMTSPSSRTFEPVPGAAEDKAFRLKIQAVQEAMTRGQATEVRFSANDLNAWFFANGRNADFADHLRFRTEADWLVADLSVPLSFMADVPFLPSVRSRYFNGRIAARLTIENGGLKIQNLDVEGNGKRLPWLFTGQSYKQTVTEGMNKGIETRLPEASQFIHRIESIKVENNEIIVKLK